MQKKDYYSYTSSVFEERKQWNEIPIITEREEKYIEIDSVLDVERFIPRTIYKKVWDENNAFLNER